MGIINVTPDSFSDGGQLYAQGRLDPGALVERAAAMIASGADILDIGGESTRPGAQPVSRDEELSRVIPVVRLIRSHFDIPISVDTSDAQVISAAAAEGADMINDVRALTRPGAMAAVAACGLPTCLMHMQNDPGTMQLTPHYDDVVPEVAHYLLARVDACQREGIPRDNIAIDPGFGFGKTLAHNMALFRGLPQLAKLGLPIVVGLSRKRMVGELLDRGLDGRRAGSLALALLAAQRGARIIRVHDVGETADVLKILNAVEGS